MNLSQIVANGFHKTFTGSDVTITEAKMKACEEFLINGKAVTKRKQAALWGRYIPCDGITNGANTSIDTGIKAQDNIEMFVRVKAITGSFYILQARNTGTGTIYGISGSQANNTLVCFGVTSGITRTDGHIYTIKASYVSGAVTLYVKDETTGEEDTKTGTASARDYPFPSPTTVKLFGDASKITSGTTVYRAYIKVNGQMAWDMYPCVDVNNSNAPVAYDNVTHAKSTVVSGSITGGSLIQPVAYAESDGTAWANTEYVLTGDEEIEFDFQYIGNYGSSAKDVFFTGTQNADTSKGGFWVEKYVRTGTWQWYVRYNSLASVFNSQVSAGLNDRYSVSIGNGSFKVNGTEVLKPTNDGTHQDTPIVIFGRMNSSGVLLGESLSVGNTQLRKTALLSRDYLPVRIGTTVELLDLVNWQFATRTGTFTAGADIPYTELCPDILETNTGDVLYGQYGSNLVDFNTLEQGSFNYINGSETASNNMVRTPWIPVKAGQLYTFSCDTTQPIGEGAYVYKKADNAIIAGSNNLVGTGLTLTIPSEVAYIRLRIGNGSYPHAVTTNYKIQLEEGSTATPYEPYHFGLHPSGEQKVLMGEQGVVDLGTLSWIYQTDGAYPVFRATINAPAVASGSPPMFTTAYSVHPSVITATFIKTNLLDGVIAYQASSATNQLMVQDSRYTTVAEFKSAMSGKYLFYQRSTDASFIPPQSRTITTFLPSATSFIDAQKASNNVECDWKFKVLDGTESWAIDGTRAYYINIADRVSGMDVVCICSHFNSLFSFVGTNVGILMSDLPAITDIPSLKSWLAAQYAKGTPVIIAYPLATPEVTTVEIAPVTLANGTNRVTASSGTVKVTANVRVI